MYAYRNKNTSDVALFDQPHPELEAANNWERVDADDAPKSARDAYDRAKAEQRMIAEAAVNRYDAVAAGALGAVDRAGVATGQVDNAAPVVPTAAHYAPVGVGDQERILAKTGDAAAVQIGQHPERHPSTKEEVAELAEWQRLNPPTDGVLARAKADHRSGAVQVGNNPEAARAALNGSGTATTTGTDANPDTTSDSGTEGGETPPAATGDDDGDTRPARSARKAALVAYATSDAAGEQKITEEEANALTRDQLAERYGR